MQFTEKGAKAVAHIKNFYQGCIDSGYTPRNAFDRTVFTLSNQPASVIAIAIGNPSSDDFRDAAKQGYGTPD